VHHFNVSFHVVAPTKYFETVRTLGLSKVECKMLFEARLTAERFVADRACSFSEVVREVIYQSLLVRKIARADAATIAPVLFDNR
jgi:hypothetical protein